MRGFVELDVRAQVTETATTLLRGYHPTASSISVNFDKLHISIEEITPVFVPCYIVKSYYDEVEYHLYVSGFNGYVGGPYLLNALYFGRLASALTVAGALLVYPNKVAGFIFGSFFAVATYYMAFYAARLYPKWRRDYNRRTQQEMRHKHQSDDQRGFRPDENSTRRTTAEYHSSTYWDTHAYEQRVGGGGGSSSSSSSGGYSSARVVRDPKGYYKTLGLEGNESINEIRSAYRKIVMQEHPDVGGSENKMVAANAAYRVLRDPKRRAAYDNSA
ncbi:DNAJ domain protein [Strigomonas culicis]|nr:DNAJ domain protein [Strigomonas culicis]|eukprot:EPY18514.1 DNAJ domain protein [Strigomonas culicis]